MPASKAQAMDARMGARGGVDRPEPLTAAALHEQYLDAVYDYVVQRVPSIEDAEDVTAEVFAAAAAGLSRFRGQCPPYLWLLSIARRQIARARRRWVVRRETLASELSPDPPHAAALWEALAAVEGPEAAVVRAEAGRTLERLLSQLCPDQREALALQYLERLSVAEIAVVMARSPASVKSLLQRAKATLLKKGRPYFAGEEEAG
jgi:RNA polymerase sigma-70 factor (ECF subfamily)